jgi:hypothetical protein
MEMWKKKKRTCKNIKSGKGRNRKIREKRDLEREGKKQNEVERNKE